MKPKKPKDSASMNKVAKTYRKTTTTSKPNWDGARYYDNMGGNDGLATTTSKSSYKPKPMGMTMGGTKKGKGATIIKTKVRK